MADFGGLYVATLTPFDGAGRLDLGVLRDHVAFLVDGGVSGVSPVGTTGEFLYLSLGEKVRIVEETCRAAGGRVPVMAGVWALTARECALLARAAEAAGASAVFLPPPIYYPASDDVVCRHYAAVREACGLPVFAYNIPAYAANAVSTPALERMAADGTVAGVKDSSGKADRMRELVDVFASRIRVMAASDSFASEGRRIGAHGFISAIGNIFPRSLVQVWGGDEAAQPAVDAVRNAIKQHGGIPATKYLASRRGYAFGGSRLPFAELRPDQRASLDAAFEAATAAGLT